MEIDDRFLLLRHGHDEHLIDRFNSESQFVELFHTAYLRAIPDVHKFFILYQLARSKATEAASFAELGVYRGGTAYMLSRLNPRTLYLFDTFSGMPETNPAYDFHTKGQFSDTSLEEVRNFVGEQNVVYCKGFFPETTAGIDDIFSFVHIDADIYQSVKDGCEWFYSRMIPGGVMLFDDYGAKCCHGAKVAIDEFFRNRTETPIYLPTGQCFVTKNVSGS